MVKKELKKFDCVHFYFTPEMFGNWNEGITEAKQLIGFKQINNIIEEMEDIKIINIGDFQGYSDGGGSDYKETVYFTVETTLNREELLNKFETICDKGITAFVTLDEKELIEKESKRVQGLIESLALW